jgi:hypothetical protein
MGSTDGQEHPGTGPRAGVSGLHRASVVHFATSNWPATPEVAGSSPVAPVNRLQIGSFVAEIDAVDRRLPCIPRRSARATSLDSPLEAGRSR